MEAISASALENFYRMVLKDFVQITEKYITDSDKNTEKESKDKDKTKEKGNDTIYELFNTSYVTIISISDKISKDHVLYESINNYMHNIKDYIDSKKEKIIDTLNTEEKDIYRAYGFIWSIRYLLNEVELEHISLFNYKEYPHFSNFLEIFGNSKNISKNYNKNFTEDRGKKKIDIKFIHEWIKKLNEGKLIPMVKKSLKKKKKKQENEYSDTQVNPISNDINNNMEEFSQKEKKEENSNNMINIEKEIPKNNVEYVQEKKSEKNGKETEDSSEDNKNKSINQNTISGTNSNNSENETINGNNNSDKNKNNANDIFTGKILEVSSINLDIKSEKNNLIDLCKNINPLSPEIRQLINIFSSQFTSLENKMTQEISALRERVQKLEVNQLMLYHQISLYQNSRDMYKNISYFFYEFLNLKQVQLTKFDKAKAIIEYLENNDKEKIKKMMDNGSESVDEKLKKKLANYFRFHYFVYLVINKIIHRNFSDEQKKILAEKSSDDVLPLLPNFDFDQCFDSLEYFIENNTKNNIINTAMNYVYEKIYKEDKNLGSIKDVNHEIIDNDENGIYIKIKKEDILDVRNYFKSIKMKNNDDFIDLCNKKTWDQADMN